MSDDTLHPAFKATLDRFCADSAQARTMSPIELAAAFSRANAAFNVKAKQAGSDIIGHAHALYFHDRRMSAAQVATEMENLREAMRELNSAFTQLDFAHAAMTVGETASRIRSAAE
jgi:hypothetical protein